MLRLPLIAGADTGSQRRRKPRRRAVVRLANGALSALNSLLGFPESGVDVPSCALHEDIRARTLDRATIFCERQDAEDVPSDESALRTLLRGRSCYSTDHAGCAVKPYGSGPVSIPTNIDDCRLLEEMLPQDDLRFLEGDHERMRNHNPELDAVPYPYFDVCLKRNRRSYLKFVKQLLKAGLVQATGSCLAEV